MTAIFANGIWKSGNHLLKKSLHLLGFKDAQWGIAAHLLLGRGQLIRWLLRGEKMGKGIPAGLEVHISISPLWLHSRV